MNAVTAGKRQSNSLLIRIRIDRIWILLLCFAFLIQDSSARIGLFTGDIKLHKAPRIFRRYTHHAPVNINIRSAPKTPIYTPKAILNKPRPYQIGIPRYTPSKIPSKYTLMEPYTGYNMRRPSLNTGRPSLNMGRPSLNMGRPVLNMGRPILNMGRPSFNRGTPGLDMYQLMMNPWFSHMINPLLLPFLQRSMIKNMKTMPTWMRPYGKIPGKTW